MTRGYTKKSGPMLGDFKQQETSTTTRAANAGQPFTGPPDTTRMTVRGTTRFVVNHSGETSSQAYGANTPFAPFKSVALTDGCSYFNWMMSAYERAYVVRSRISVEVVNATVADSIMVVLSYDGDTNVSTNIDTLAESRHSKSGLLGHYSGGKNSIKMVGHYSPRAFQGMSWNSADNVVTLEESEPLDPYYWIVSARSVAGGTGNLAYYVAVEYDVEFAELKAPAPSV